MTPIQTIEHKWLSGEKLEAQELELLRLKISQDPDIRVRESCRVLLAAIEGKTEAEPHVQRLVQTKNSALLRRRTQPGRIPL